MISDQISDTVSVRTVRFGIINNLLLKKTYGLVTVPYELVPFSLYTVLYVEAKVEHSQVNIFNLMLCVYLIIRLYSMCVKVM